MRGFSLIAAATALLTGCGAPEPSNQTDVDAEVGDPGSNDANAAGNLVGEPVAEAADAAAADGADPANACLMQGQQRLEVPPIRATGTEPFWSARVEGRCVTYSTPEDQQGTRVWTRYSASPNGGGAWTGQLAAKPFEMRTRREAGCSDGMSDKSYPIAVELTVGGEQRRGCAEPL